MQARDQAIAWQPQTCELGIMMHTLVCLLASGIYVRSVSYHALGGNKLHPAWRMGCRGRQHTGCM